MKIESVFYFHHNMSTPASILVINIVNSFSLADYLIISLLFKQSSWSVKYEDVTILTQRLPSKMCLPHSFRQL